MKVTKKEVTKEVEKVLEIEQDEFIKVCALAAAEFLSDVFEDNKSNDELFFLILLGAYTSCICSKLFDENDKDESEEK